MIRAYIALCILFVFSYAQAVQVSIEDNGNVRLLSAKGARDYSLGDTIRLDAGRPLPRRIKAAFAVLDLSQKNKAFIMN